MTYTIENKDGILVVHYRGDNGIQGLHTELAKANIFQTPTLYHICRECNLEMILYEMERHELPTDFQPFSDENKNKAANFYQQFIKYISTNANYLMLFDENRFYKINGVYQIPKDRKVEDAVKAIISHEDSLKKNGYEIKTKKPEHQ